MSPLILNCPASSPSAVTPGTCIGCHDGRGMLGSAGRTSRCKIAILHTPRQFERAEMCCTARDIPRESCPRQGFLHIAAAIRGARLDLVRCRCQLGASLLASRAVQMTMKAARV
jgi:hypothetical protein